MQIEKSLFENIKDNNFVLELDDEISVSLVLTEVDSPEAHIVKRAIEEGFREPFSLLFHGPSQPILNQHMYRLKHVDIGEVDLFLVPVDQDEKGFYYEAVFS